MEKLFLLDEVKCLTTKGLKFTHELTNNDILLVATEDGELVECDDFTICRDEFSSGYYNTDSEYTGLVTYLPLSSLSNSTRIYEIMEKSNEVYSSIFRINNKNYKNIPIDAALVLSIVISTYFNKKEENVLVPKSTAISKTLYSIFARFNKEYSVFFPYDRVNKCYKFKTTIFSDPMRLSAMLLENREYFANMIPLFTKLNVALGYNYKAIWLGTYDAGCILQVLLSLCDYKTKLIFDKTQGMWKLTFVPAIDANYKSKFRACKQFYLDKPRTFTNITLNNLGASLILTQDNNANTSVSIIKTNNNL